MNVSVQNLEEASLLASEFISSIDNLPNEVQHLLQEIRHKDLRSQELHQELSRDQARFIRDTSAPGSGFFNNASPSSDSPTSSIPTSAISPPTHLLPTKVTQTYSQLTQLADEKLLLAQKIIDIIIKSKARLDFDLAKVRALHGESGSSSAPLNNPALLGSGDPIVLHPVVNSSALAGASSTASAYAGRGYASNHTSGANTPIFSADSSTTTTLIAENIRNAILLAPDVLPLSPAATAAAMASATASNTKRRRVASSTNSIKLPSPAPHHHHHHHHHRHPSSTPTSRSRLSRQLRVPAPTNTIDDDDEDLLRDEIGARSGGGAGGGESLLADIDAEGDEDIEGEDAEDSTLYCFCQKPGAGEMMIGCDNSSCPYQWFHISCVGVKQPLPDKWYCQECKSKGAGAPTRKGRKKAS